jgi:hypothetical protein
MSGNTEIYYKDKKLVKGFDLTSKIQSRKYIPAEVVTGVPVLIPDKVIDSKGGLGWETIRYADTNFPSAGYAITTTVSSEYSWTLPRNLKRIKNFYMLYSATAGSATPALGMPLSYGVLQISGQSLPISRREHINLMNTGFEPTAESFTHSSVAKGFSSALASDATSTSAEQRVIDLSFMIPRDLHTLDTDAEVLFKYQFDTVANTLTTGATITITGVYFVFDIWLDTDEEWAEFKKTVKLGKRMITYLEPILYNAGTVTSSSSATTTLVLQSLDGRMPMFAVGLYDSSVSINQVSHIYIKMTSVGILDSSDNNIITSWDISEALGVILAQKRGMSTGLYTYITHAVPFIFCKDIYNTLWNHNNTGGLNFKNAQAKLRILPSTTASGTFSAHVIGFYYCYFILDERGNMLGNYQRVH